MAALVNRIESRRQSHDCATWSLATYLGVPYERVWQTVQKVDRSKGRGGLYPRTMIRVAEALGFTMRLLRKVDEEAYGILCVDGHVVVQRNGLIFDTDATVWDAHDWLKAHAQTPKGILVLSA